MKAAKNAPDAQALDEDRAAQAIEWARVEMEQAERSVVRLRGQLDDAIGAARARRMDIGRVLVGIRPKWPARGPNAKGWGLFLARVKLDDSTAFRYMAEYRDPDGFSQSESGKSNDDDDIGGALSENTGAANVFGGSGEPVRGSFCTPRKYALAVGPWDLDPFSNPRSHIVSEARCMLEDGGDGLDHEGVDPGAWRMGSGAHGRADAGTRVWLQPVYAHGFVARAVAHYKHTRFCALLRFAPDTAWFADLWPRVAVIAAPLERLPFETPDGVQVEGADEGGDAGAPFPHVLYYSDVRDVTDEIRRLCIVLRRDEARPQLTIVKGQ